MATPNSRLSLDSTLSPTESAEMCAVLCNCVPPEITDAHRNELLAQMPPHPLTAAPQHDSGLGWTIALLAIAALIAAFIGGLR